MVSDSFLKAQSSVSQTGPFQETAGDGRKSPPYCASFHLTSECAHSSTLEWQEGLFESVWLLAVGASRPCKLLGRSLAPQKWQD